MALKKVYEGTINRMESILPTKWRKNNRRIKKIIDTCYKETIRLKSLKESFWNEAGAELKQGNKGAAGRLLQKVKSSEQMIEKRQRMVDILEGEYLNVSLSRCEIEELEKKLLIIDDECEDYPGPYKDPNPDEWDPLQPKYDEGDLKFIDEFCEELAKEVGDGCEDRAEMNNTDLVDEGFRRATDRLRSLMMDGPNKEEVK